MNVSNNPENPFVKDVHFFANAIPYTKTALHFIHKTNNFVAFVIGILLVCLLTYLILVKTPMHFRTYSKILLLCVMNDSLILIVHIVVQCRIKISYGIIILSVNGPLSSLPYDTQCKLIGLQGLSATIAFASLPLQYFYRWATLKSRQPPSNLKTSVYYFILLSFVVIFSFMVYNAYRPNAGDLPDIDYAEFWFEENPIPQLIVGNFLSKRMFYAIIYLSSILCVCYGLIIWFAKETMRELKDQEFVLTERTKVLQAQFSKTLLVQALTPLLTSVIPLAFVCFVMATSISSTGYAGELIILSLTWFPALNSLTNIIFIGPYRQHCLKVLSKYKLLSAVASLRSSRTVIDSSQLPVSNISTLH